MVMGYKVFSLKEARELIPTLRKMLSDANEELADKLVLVQAANECYEQAEEAVDSSEKTAEIGQLRAARASFQESIEQLSVAQNSYISRLNYWVDRITDTGVILRDIREGLLDFPGEQNGLQYFLCWRADEEDIQFWHLANDGFTGRKPLSALSEFC
jgi:hypothetical protein